MKKLAALLLAVALPAAAQTLEERVDRLLPKLVKTYQSLHATPELSTQEAKTSAFVAARLRELGVEVTERVGTYQDGGTCYGVVGVLRNGAGPTVLIRSDMDGLPVTEQTGLAYASTVRAKGQGGDEVGVMHACGHDVHMTTLIGTAEMLIATRDRWSGTVLFVGQPAEEVVKGAAGMLAGGLYERFPRPDYAVAFHDMANIPAGKVGYVSGYIMAGSDSIDVTVRGAGGHGATPHITKDPVVLAAELILALQTIVSRERSPLDPVVVTVGSVHGGTKRNIIPDEVTLNMTVRTFKPDVRERVLGSISRIANGLAAAAGVASDRMPIVNILTSESVEPTWNDPALTERLARSMAKELGETNVVASEPQMVAEDFGRFGLGRQIPTSMMNLGAGDPALIAAGTQPGLHSSRFAPSPEITLRTGIRAMTAALLDLLAKP
ncbi:MAG: amidohydrolase [Thermoanaerobaculia bacterium]